MPQGFVSSLGDVSLLLMILFLADFNLHVYDMTAPQIPGKTPNLLHYDNDSGHRTTMKVLKTIKGIPEGWTITDSHLSPDNERYFPLLCLFGTH